jgi:hypothetical protein
MFAKRINGGLLLTIGLPLFAICASVGTTIVAFTRGDPTLPGEYHWEGMQLDRDFADANRALELNVRATLFVTQSSGLCRLSVRLEGPPPEALRLSLIHGTRPDLDRQVPLSRAGSAYEGQCGAVPPGHWHVELTDEAGAWSVREDVFGALDGKTISARVANGT